MEEPSQPYYDLHTYARGLSSPPEESLRGSDYLYHTYKTNQLLHLMPAGSSIPTDMPFD